MSTAILLLLTAPLAVGQAANQPIVIESAVLTLLDQREAPARLPGVLDRINVRELQAVKKGDPLATIDDREAEIEVDRAIAKRDDAQLRSESDAKVQVATKVFELAQSEQKRLTDRLARFPDSASPEEVEKKNIEAEKSQAELLDAQLEFRAAKFELRVSEAELRLAQRKMEQHHIHSPIDGIVVKVSRREGEWVQPGEVVFRILRLDRLRAEGFIDAAAVPADIIGRRAAFRVAGDKSIHEGVITYVSPEVNPADGKTRIWAEIDNPDMKLRPGVRGTLGISR